VPADKHKAGFVLVAAVVVLALAAVIMAAVARSSSALALKANAAREKLELRWAAISLKRLLLPQVEAVICEDEARLGKPSTWARRTIHINGVEFELVFGDEQARANVNAIYASKGAIGLTAALEAFQRECRSVLKVELKPADSPAIGRDIPKQPFACLDQLFTACHPEQLARPFADEAPLSSDFTCWGSGRLNFRRASRAALEEMTSGLLTASQQAELMQLRCDVPGVSLEEALRLLELTDAQRAEAVKTLTDISACYSLWIVARTAGRRWYWLVVRDVASDQAVAANAKVFAW